MEQTIPVADLGEWERGARGRDALAATLGGALEQVGFVAVTNHGVDRGLIDRAYDLAARFFALPEPAKRAYDVPELHGQRGFTAFGREHAKGRSVGDLKEFFHVGRELPASHPLAALYGRNIFPAELPDFAPTMLELYRQLERCAERLVEACAVYLGEPEGLFRDMVAEGDTILRIIHYPPVPPDACAEAMRAAPHEDINLVTLLCGATAEGLELLERDGSWRPVRAVEGQIVVDAGDMLQHLTNGLFRSTTHRVTSPPGDRERRYSMPFFVHARADVDIAPLPGCVARTGGVAKYPSRTARDYLEERLREIGLAE